MCIYAIFRIGTNNVYMENAVIKRIIEIKKKEKLTNESLSEKIGASVETIKSMFSKKTNPSVDTLCKIKSAFPHYTLDWIITGIDETQPSIKSTPEVHQSNESRFLSLIESQQRVVESQQRMAESLSRTIETLTRKPD